jgi:two-component system LytT family sensor kinase
MSEAPRPSRAYWICQLAGWGAYGLLGVTMSRAFGYGTPRMMATTLLGGLIGAVVTHLWRGAILRRGWLGLGFGRLLPRLVAGVAVTAIAAELLVWATGLFVTGAYTMRTSTPAIMFATTSNWLITVMLWTAIYVGAHWFTRWRGSEIQRLRLEVLARDAQLEALHAQIQPHFLFNAMNALRALITEHPARARDLVTELSELMRYALQAGRRERVALAEELAVVESYLRIESARFEERLAWRIDAEDAVRTIRLPPMLLQMLVENAVKHGIAPSERGGEVTIAACREGDRVRLRVTNPGYIGTHGDTRIGLANARERLRLIYGERAALTLSEKDGCVVAEVTLPAEGPA